MFLFKSGLKLIMRYASKIFRSKKPLHSSKIFAVKVLLQAAVSACKSLKCEAIAELHKKALLSDISNSAMAAHFKLILLTLNSFVDIFQNNFIDSKNNVQAFKSFNDKCD